MGMDIDPVSGSTGMLCISSVALLILPVFLDGYDLVFRYDPLPGRRDVYRKNSFTALVPAGNKKALPINQKSFLLCFTIRRLFQAKLIRLTYLPHIAVGWN
jgi:hypothetical protein